jgi:hypothetical protein
MPRGLLGIRGKERDNKCSQLEAIIRNLRRHDLGQGAEHSRDRLA